MSETTPVLSTSSTPSSIPPPTGAEESGWTLTFHDEFDGGQLNTSIWNTLPSPDCVINNEKQAYVFDALQVQGGLLTIKIEKRNAPYGDSCPSGKKEMNYTSGLISSRGNFSQTYGWFEIRAKLPHADGTWPSFWLLPETPIGPGGTYSPAAEVDILEHVAHLGNQIFVGMHWNGYGKDHQLWGTQPAIRNLLEGFHTFALDWQPRQLTFYVDGKPVAEHTGKEVPSVPLYLNIAAPVGGDFGGAINDATLPDTFQIDYVRVYQKSQ
jgi:beta-glucanase (GH16 family)